MSVFWPFLAVAAIALVEYLIARMWVGAYYRVGLPLVRKRLVGARLDPAIERRFDALAEDDGCLVFERLSESEIAFREKSQSNVTFRYLPVLHGLVRYVPEEGATYVIGWLNYWVLGAIALYTYIFVSAPSFNKPWDVLVMFVILFLIMCGIGVWRYHVIAKKLSRAETAPQSSPAR